jgi:hypothetical protein
MNPQASLFDFYVTQSASIRHIGPMAQDLYAIFNRGEDGHDIISV